MSSTLKGKKEKEGKEGGWRTQLFKLVGCSGEKASKEKKRLDTYEREKFKCMQRHKRGDRFTHYLRKVIQEDAERYKEVFSRIQLRLKAVDATKEWSTLPKRPKNKERKVWLLDVNPARDVWYYEEEERPKVNLQKWRVVMMDMLETVEWNDKVKEWKAEDPNSYEYKLRKMLMMI